MISCSKYLVIMFFTESEEEEEMETEEEEEEEIDLQSRRLQTRRSGKIINKLDHFILASTNRLIACFRPKQEPTRVVRLMVPNSLSRDFTCKYFKKMKNTSQDKRSSLFLLDG
jgi:hypothetical protein